MDLAVAASGSGYGHTECPQVEVFYMKNIERYVNHDFIKHLLSQGIPIEFALLSILAAFGVAFGVLYMALTQQTMGRRRRRRRSGVDDQLSHQHHGEEEEDDVAVSLKLADIFMLGEFQNGSKSFIGK